MEPLPVRCCFRLAPPPCWMFMFPNLDLMASISRCISLILSDSEGVVWSTDMRAAAAFLGRTAASISAAAVRSFSLVSRLWSLVLIWALMSLSDRLLDGPLVSVPGLRLVDQLG